MSELQKAARELVKALDVTSNALNRYYSVAKAIGFESGNPTERGFDSKQIQRRLQAEVVGRLSSSRDSVLKLEGAPQARRFIAANKLPGL